MDTILQVIAAAGVGFSIGFALLQFVKAGCSSKRDYWCK
jgi:hypothetical protein